MSETNHHVVVLGATVKQDRYANMAQRLLMEKGYSVTPVHPKLAVVEGVKVANQLADAAQPVDTLTLYVGADRLAGMLDEIIALKPGRVLFNPGTESQALKDRLDEAGIPWTEGCTLVMLKTGTFHSWP